MNALCAVFFSEDLVAWLFCKLSFKMSNSHDAIDISSDEDDELPNIIKYPRYFRVRLMNIVNNLLLNGYILNTNRLNCWKSNARLNPRFSTMQRKKSSVLCNDSSSRYVG